MSPVLPTGPVTAAQAAAIEKHFDVVENKAIVARDPKGLASVEACSVLSTNTSFAAADRAIGFTPQGYAALGTTLVPAGFVAPASKVFPQQFLYVENYRRPSARFTPYSLNVFTRSAAGAPWKLCAYPNLFDKTPLPTFATVAKNVVPVVGAADVARAKHAASLLAAYLTTRATHKVAPPAGLTVPFGSCPTKYPQCNPPGIDDPYFTPTSSVSSTYRVTTTAKPTYSYPLANGDTLTIAELHVVTRDTAVTGYLQQDSKRSFWNILLAPGDFHSVTLTDELSVVLEVAPSGSARLVGADVLEQSATSTPR